MASKKEDKDIKTDQTSAAKSSPNKPTKDKKPSISKSASKKDSKKKAKSKPKKDTKKKKKKHSPSPKKLNEKHKEYLRKYVAEYLTNKKTIAVVYMEVYGWPKSYQNNQAKKLQAAVSANRIMNAPGAKEYIHELQSKVLDHAEHEDVIRPITEDLKILDQIIQHNALGTETKIGKDKKEYEVSNLTKVSKAHTAIRAIETKAKIMGEMRVRVLKEDEVVDLSEEAMDARLKALAERGAIVPKKAKK